MNLNSLKARKSPLLSPSAPSSVPIQLNNESLIPVHSVRCSIISNSLFLYAARVPHRKTHLPTTGRPAELEPHHRMALLIS